MVGRPGRFCGAAAKPHPLLEKPGHLPAHLGRVGAVGQIQSQAVRPGRRTTQSRVADTGHLPDGVQDGVDIEPLGALPQRSWLVVATQVGGDAGEFRGLGGGSTAGGSGTTGTSGSAGTRCGSTTALGADCRPSPAGDVGSGADRRAA